MTKANGSSITIKRSTAESTITVSVSRSEERNEKLKAGINTGLQFLNHMVETLAWRSCMNIGAEVKMDDYQLTHVIAEDLGLTYGEALLKLIEKDYADGINGSGAAVCCIDEALARVAISFEGRALINFTNARVQMAERVEDMNAADLKAFLEGFTQGAKLTLHVDLLKGDDPHHCWEAIFRAVGEAIREAFGDCPWRQGTTPGVKGSVTIEEG